MKDRIEINNRQAGFNYFVIETYEAGIVLQGCEVKSIRNREVNISDSYCVVENGEMIIKNLHISPYKDSGYSYRDYQPKRDRKLLLTKREIRKIHQEVKTKGVTIVPLKLYSNERGLMKISIAIAKGKKTYDKSQTIKERDLDREMRDV